MTASLHLCIYFADENEFAPYIDKKHAVTFLKRHKRSSEEECDEGCNIEEMLENFDNYELSVSTNKKSAVYHIMKWLEYIDLSCTGSIWAIKLHWLEKY